MTERCSPFNEEAFQEEDGRDTALSADLFLWEERQKRQRKMPLHQLVYRLISRQSANLSAENRQMVLSTLGTIGGFTIDATFSAISGVRPGTDPTFQLMIFALGSSWGFLWGAKRYLEGMNG